MTTEFRHEDPVPPATPLVETEEPSAAGTTQAVLHEAADVHRGFSNWLPLLVAIAVGRAQRRPRALRMRARSGPTLWSPEGDRSWWTAVEVFGRDCYRLGSAGMPASPTVVDVGANIGAFALAVSASRPRAHVSAYEASPAAVAALQANVAANGAGDRVSVHHCAVIGAPERGTVWLNEQQGDLCTSSVVLTDQACPAATHRVEVPATTLGAVLRSHPNGVDLLKMDVEGAEYEIVAATPIDQLARVARVVLEYHEVPGHQVSELADRLGAAGLVWELQEHGARPGHGLGWWRRQDADR